MATSACACSKRPRRPFSAQPNERTQPSADSSSTWSAPELIATTRSSGVLGSKTSAGERCTRAVDENPAAAAPGAADAGPQKVSTRPLAGCATV